MKLLLAGDFHGNHRHAQKTANMARRLGMDAVVQLGDFGFTWDGPQRLGGLNNIFAQFEMPLYWIDGNHENFDVMEDMGAFTDADHMVKMGSHVTYIPRGYVWEWDGVSFLAMGGAYSIDKEWREPGKSWWPQELITDADVERAYENLGPNGVDVMLTHDAPELPEKLREYMYDPYNEYGDYKTDRSSTDNRIRLAQVMEAAKPQLYVHGHMHHRYSDTMGDTHIEGLDRDTTGDSSWAVIHTDDIKSKERV